ncbi:transcription termination factor Rho [Pseudonocardia xinjiangensis]|uniref:transcription termination factor Rho n=1 Tax=Pseudonocardia xinjiangensis TaxID=75289 RepID=UPI003D8D7CD7
MSETDLVSTESAPAPRKRGGLTGMVLAELRQLAGELNIPDTSGMRKGDLIAAIKEKQGAAPTRKPAAAQLSLPENGTSPTPTPTPAPAETPAVTDGPPTNGSAPAAPAAEAAPAPTTPTRRRRTASRPAGAPDVTTAVETPAPSSRPEVNGSSAPEVAPPVDTAPTNGVAPAVESAPAPSSAPEAPAPDAEPEQGSRRTRQSRRNRGEQSSPDTATDSGAGESPSEDRQRGRTRGEGRDDRADNRNGDTRPERGESRNDRAERNDRGDNRTERNDRADNRAERNDRTDNRPDNRQDGNRSGGRPDNRPDNRADNRADNRGPRDNRPDDDDDEGDGRGRRGRRFRDRRRGRDRERPAGGQGGGQGNVDTEVRDGDVLLPVAGIIDVLDNYAFVRTTGYLSGPTDVYVSLSMVRKYGLRRGDAITGAVREPREGEQSRQKFNPLVRVDSINGQDPENSRNRPEFTKLTPLYPNERLRLETEPSKLTPRVIDLVMPIGKGQRALIVSPPKAGKTMIMQSIANAITTNNPECHLMVVLVDERPEEVTDMQRSVKGEVIASTFDRPPSDHTTVAELAIERAKRLVEMGHDVVVLLDSITRLGRAYNLAAPASGRILSGGVDSTALYPPKRFLGAARNIEDGGSLTIFATALVETGSTMDTVIFEEFKGTGNAELKLDRRIADKRVFPAIDIDASGTRKEELLLSPDELAVTVKLRRVLSALDDQQALDLVLTQLRKTRTNIEFLMQVAKSTPGSDD